MKQDKVWLAVGIISIVGIVFWSLGRVYLWWLF